MVLRALVLLFLFACSIAYAAETAKMERPGGPVPVSEPVSIRMGGKVATLAIIQVRGGTVTDEAPSAICRERVEGEFAARVIFENGRVVDTPLNALMNTEKLAFCAKSWTVITADYNHDGLIDFNLGQFANSNGWEYRLFTVGRSGRVSLLNVENGGSVIYIADDGNSTKRIETIRHGIKSTSYVNACGEGECGWWEAVYRWNGRRKAFEAYGAGHLPFGGREEFGAPGIQE